MIPRTFPSTFAANGQQQMVVYSLPSITGLTAWIDYIPVKGVTTESATLENTYANGGYQVVDSLASLTGKQAWLDYIPVYEDASYTKPWSTDAGGYIPTSALAALLLDFTSGRLDPRITFSRTTNATLTNSAGLVANAPMNLLTFSEQFDNAAWIKVTAPVVTANAIAAPDGTVTADLFAKTTTNFQAVRQSVTLVSAATVSESVHAKRGLSDYIAFTDDGSCALTVDLRDGTITRNTAFSSVVVTPAGDGWFRISYSRARGAGATSALYMWPTDVANSASFTTASSSVSCYVWGAQLELGSTATTYNPTTVKNLLGFTEHFDNAAWTKSNSFVQTNLLLQSEAFDDASWEKASVTVAANVTTAPDGTATAESAVPTADLAAHRIRKTPITLAADTATYSIFVKANGYNKVALREGQTTGAAASFDLATGTVLSIHNAGVVTVSNNTITDVGNGWYRIACTFTGTTAQRFDFLVLDPAYTSGTVALSWTANGTDGIFLWGAQLVQGESAGDYKATTSAAAAVGYPDIYGQPFAQKLVETTANAQHAVFAAQTLTAAPYTFSVYAKQSGSPQRWLTLFPQGTGVSASAIFDVNSGSVTATAGSQYLGSSITPVGNDWYRCSITFTAAAVSVSNVAYLNNSSTIPAPGYTGDGTSGIYIFGAQLSDSASVDPYVYQPVAAPSSVAYYGPRFDYDPVTLAPKGLLIEEQRVNYCLYSEDFTQASWTKSNTTVTGNSAVSPSGAVTADTITASSANGTVRQAIVTTAVPFTFSIYLKRKTGTGNVDISMDGTTWVNQTIDAVNWTRCIVTQTGVAGTSNPGIRLVTSGDEVYAWGAQAE